MKKRHVLMTLGAFTVLGLLYIAYAEESLVIPSGDFKSTWYSTSLGEGFWWAKRLAYAIVSLDMSKSGISYLLQNLDKLVLMNPNPGGGEVLKYIGLFIRIVLPLYLLGIVVTGFYLLLISGSPSGRARAKFLMRDLVVGMVAVSMSPWILQLFTDVSYQAANAILSQTDVGIVTGSMSALLGGESWNPAEHLCPLCVLHMFVTFIEIELGYYTFLPFFLIVWGTLIFFFIRFGVVTLWMMIFPVSVFLYSFETTRDVGRNMLEQTLLWVYMQVFEAVILVAIALCLIQIPEGLMSVGLGSPTLGGTMEDTFLWLLPSVLFDFIPFIGCIIMAIAPLLMLRLFKGFLP